MLASRVHPQLDNFTRSDIKLLFFEPLRGKRPDNPDACKVLLHGRRQITKGILNQLPLRAQHDPQPRAPVNHERHETEAE